MRETPSGRLLQAPGQRLGHAGETELTETTIELHADTRSSNR